MKRVGGGPATRKQGYFTRTSLCAPIIANRNELDNPENYGLSFKSQNDWKAGRDRSRDVELAGTKVMQTYVCLLIRGTSSSDVFIGLHRWVGHAKFHCALCVQITGR
jgi:hypothetical protein